jgi:hypothetical protein
MCCVWISVKQQLLPCATLTDCFCVTEVNSIYCAVCTEFLYKTDVFVFKGLIQQWHTSPLSTYSGCECVALINRRFNGLLTVHHSDVFT